MTDTVVLYGECIGELAIWTLRTVLREASMGYSERTRPCAEERRVKEAGMRKTWCFGGGKSCWG